jgi:dienelactone hydrolase
LVIVIDLMYWGERRMILDDDPDDFRERNKDLPLNRVSAFNVRSSQYEALVSRTLMSAGMTWPGLIIWDDLRTVDYLLTRPEVDRNRIGSIGFSLGGSRSCFLGALDDRVKTSVVAGWMTSIPHQLKSDIKFTIGLSMLIPGLNRYLDYPDIAAMHAPKPLLVMTGTQDGLFSAKGRLEGYQKLKKSYEKAGYSDKLVMREFEAGHVFSEEMQNAAIRFLKENV